MCCFGNNAVGERGGHCERSTRQKGEDCEGVHSGDVVALEKEPREVLPRTREAIEDR